MTRPLQLASLSLVVAAAVISAVAYPYLPDQIPTHWNAAGEIDDTTAKPWGPFVGPLLLALTWGVLAVLPAISPRGFLIDDFRSAYDVIAFVLIAFLFVVAQTSIVAALGYHVPIAAVILTGLGLVLAVIGNYMGKMRRNFFVGIRTPWTLASEEVWLRTHRLGGKVFVVAGVLTVVLVLSGVHEFAVIGLLVAAALIPVVYSYIVYRRVGVGE